MLPERAHGMLPERAHGMLPERAHGTLPERAHGMRSTTPQPLRKPEHAEDDPVPWRFCLQKLLDVVVPVFEPLLGQGAAVGCVREQLASIRSAVASSGRLQPGFEHRFSLVCAEIAQIARTGQISTVHKLQRADAEIDALKCELNTLQDTVQELRGSVRVFCRVRPPRQDAEPPSIHVEDTRRLVLQKGQSGHCLDYCFDRVYSSKAGQRSVYQEVAPLLDSVLDGFHLCIFAYGQTGSGKTYTLFGAGPDASRAEAGIQELAIQDLLEIVQKRSRTRNVTYQTSLTAVEIYNECLHDLLSRTPSSNFSEQPERLEIRQVGHDEKSSSGNGPPSPFGRLCVPGLTSWDINTSNDVYTAMRRIASKRHTASTHFNDSSSRSHCIVSLNFWTPNGGSEAARAAGRLMRCGALHVVDLAGSERTKGSSAGEAQMQETNSINRSLSCLADVLYAIGESKTGRSHVPYRNSKLTYLLQDVLGGLGTKMLVFAQVSPDASDAQETHSTLTFASRVARIEVGHLRPRSASPLVRARSVPAAAPAHRNSFTESRAGRMSPMRSPSRHKTSRSVSPQQPCASSQQSLSSSHSLWVPSQQAVSSPQSLRATSQQTSGRRGGGTLSPHESPQPVRTAPHGRGSWLPASQDIPPMPRPAHDFQEEPRRASHPSWVREAASRLTGRLAAAM
eukprot:TRINITY_DN87912_c0_g1_i1.p1 TRINITY_DN87912_c0_g1~~TRINITY_DN87912_c0_g1_i1.p1  ORF type:complete len:678 (+),score=80.49 TRINITY_DN87912_c0_g1_i1:1-2034(+)